MGESSDIDWKHRKFVQAMEDRIGKVWDDIPDNAVLASFDTPEEAVAFMEGAQLQWVIHSLHSGFLVSGKSFSANRAPLVTAICRYFYQDAIWTPHPDRPNDVVLETIPNHDWVSQDVMKSLVISESHEVAETEEE